MQASKLEQKICLKIIVLNLCGLMGKLCSYHIYNIHIKTVILE